MAPRGPGSAWHSADKRFRHVAPILPERTGQVKLCWNACCWSMKMSPRNCSVKVSPHDDMGDTHDESEGSAADRVTQGLGGEAGDGTRSRHRVGRDCAAGVAPQGPLRVFGRPGL